MTRLLIIIPASIVGAVRAASAAVYGPVALTEFVAAGSPTGEVPATHWWLAGLFTDAEMSFVPALQSAFPTAHVEAYEQDGRPSARLAEMGLRPLAFHRP